MNPGLPISRHRALTLIELLIVIAIVAILTEPVLMLYLTVTRTARSAAVNQASFEQMSSLATTWRSDVCNAQASLPTTAERETSTHTMILKCMPSERANAPDLIVYRAVPDVAAGTVSVDRVGLGTEGAEVFSQRLASGLSTAEFGHAGNGAFVTLKLAGPQVVNQTSRAAYTVLAAIGEWSQKP